VALLCSAREAGLAWFGTKCAGVALLCSAREAGLGMNVWRLELLRSGPCCERSCMRAAPIMEPWLLLLCSAA